MNNKYVGYILAGIIVVGVVVAFLVFGNNNDPLKQFEDVSGIINNDNNLLYAFDNNRLYLIDGKLILKNDSETTLNFSEGNIAKIRKYFSDLKNNTEEDKNIYDNVIKAILENNESYLSVLKGN